MEKTDEIKSDYFLTYIPRWVVVESAIVVITPFFTYLGINWAMYFAISGAIRWSVENNKSESKPVSYFFMVCFILTALYSLWIILNNDDENSK